MARKLEVLIVGDASSLEKALGSAKTSAGGFSGGIQKASKVAVGAFAALGLGAKIGFDELAESQKVSAQTGAVLKSTANAARVTQTQIEALAGALSKKTGVDDEAIQSGQNMLLTFTKIRNEAGKGRDIFNQATKATLDLSVAMGKDMQSSAILVGKALNDPVKGMSALSRAGIQFTAEQKEMVKGMIASGDTMGAQKLILKELETQFGGSANAAGKTLTGSINKAKNSFLEMAAQLVSALLPTLLKLTAFVQTASKWMTEHQRAVQIGAVALAGLAAAVLLVNAAMKVASATTIVFTAVQKLLNTTIGANPFVRAAIVVAALTAALIVAYKESETFRNIVNGVFQAVKTAVATAINFMLGLFDRYLGGIQAILTAASKLPFVGDKFRGLADSVGKAREQVRELQTSIDNLKSKDITISTTITRVYKERSEVLPGAPIGRRAHGGPVKRGLPYLVGEKGPEIMWPSMAGKIIPNIGRGLSAAASALALPTGGGATTALAGAGGSRVAPAGWGTGDIVVKIGESEIARVVRTDKTKHERVNGQGSW